MNSNEFLNSISTISSALKSYEALYGDVKNRDIFEQETTNILSLLCDNVSQNSTDCINDSDISKSSPLGKCVLSFPPSQSLSNTLNCHLTKYIENGQIVVPFHIDYEKCFSMILEVDTDAEAASVLAQYTLLSTLEKNQNLHFDCVKPFICSVSSFLRQI